jgi:Rrf2 family transcriptional regulator, iron-sulfur cluster assembly transcription factor
MELSLGNRADYALRATLDLANHPDIRRKTREIGDGMEIPVTFLPQIMAQLVRAGVVDSFAGPRGGYLLARPAAAISLLEVIEAVEGDPVSKECILRSKPCRWEGICAMHVPWFRAQQAMLDQLGATTLADVAAIDEALLEGDYQPPAAAARTMAGTEG